MDSPPLPPSGGSPIRLLIADDEAPQRLALRETLADRGYLATGVGSAREALDALGTGAYDLLLTDLRMPGMDGVELLRAAAKIDPDLVAVVMTGHGSIATAVDAMKAGALDYILKPFSLAAVLPVLARAAMVRRLRAENAALARSVAAHHAALEAENRDLEAFSFSVSHDLRGPLCLISGFVELLQAELGEGASLQARRFFDRILSAVHEMSGLVTDLMRLAKITRTELCRGRVDLSALAAEVLAGLRSREAAREVDTVVAAGVTASGDPGLLRIALENLLGNAWKYTAKTDRARIEFGAEPLDGGALAAFVRDNGAGFDLQEAADKLFTPFQRFHRLEDFSGTGIGLTTVHRIVEKHGGRIWAKSAVNQGATFYLALPGLSVHP
jgi:signal transduction histidine kinase